MIQIPTEVPTVPDMQTAVQPQMPVQGEPYVRIENPNGTKRCGKLTNAEVQAFMRRRRNIDLLESLFWLLAVIYLFMLVFVKKAV